MRLFVLVLLDGLFNIVWLRLLGLYRKIPRPIVKLVLIFKPTIKAHTLNLAPDYT